MAKHKKTAASLLTKLEELRDRLEQIERGLNRAEGSCPPRSETVSASDRVRETAERYRDDSKSTNIAELALEATGVVMLALDSQGRIIHFNQGAEQLTGFTAADLLGRSLWKTLIPQEEADSVRLTFARLETGARTNQHESSILTRQGKRHQVAWSNTAIPDLSGMIRYIVSSGIDVTKKTAHKAIQANEAKRDEKEKRRIREIRARLELVSPRENDVLRLVVAGKPNKSIASHLEISIKTVEHHRSKLMKKMRADNIAELVRMTMLAGWH